ncbi:hypothetical protein F2Q70_00015864 [Brassica cretica]|uniref:GTD-binding domain-containing protein n=1 Tax=Brassica cretica TaxID=69181 RepID=A0A8S9HW63_BRACR|nr:hypothetical protein F2Q70_00015864 [Brassica cretica]
MGCPEGLLNVDRLKSELEEERKALNAVYEELEEERSASATAANETMAMINRLHEEKAAMQREALQYQRMMEEQSEFDQEALQLLNELMVEREELEVCRKRLEEYETKEKIEMIMRRMREDSPVDSDENTPDESNVSINGKYHFHGKHRVLKSKRLLPLFDAVDGEMGNGNHYENGVNESESGEIVTVEEVEELYERIEALKGTKVFDLIRKVTELLERQGTARKDLDAEGKAIKSEIEYLSD